MIYNAQIKVNIQGYGNADVYYSYNDNTNFQDLLEYLAYLIPIANICLCSKFSYYNYHHYYDIKIDEKIINFKKGFNKLYLNKNKNNCSCNYSFLYHSKLIFYQNFMNEYNKLKKKNNFNTKEMAKLQKEKNYNLLMFENLKKQNDSQNIQIKNLKEENIKQIKDIQSLKSEINQLNIDKKNLEIATKESPEKNVFGKKNGIAGENLKMKDNIIKVDPYSNQLIENEKYQKEKYQKEKYQKEKYIDFYDVIIHINSIKDLNKGWPIEMSPEGKKNYEKFKNEKIFKIGVIGNLNKGKSFILSEISGIPLPHGNNIRTKGLSIKYPDLAKFKDRKIILLDSAGVETPILKIDKNITDDEYFKKKLNEKIVTELFLRNYIINNSDIIIAVVGILTYSEQKLLMKIKEEIEWSKLNTPLFIIHNLITYTSVQQVNDYINEFLLNSATFSLVEGHKISTRTESKTGIYFYEENKEQKIYHLIFANEGSDAGRYFNQFTLDFLENNYQNVTHLEAFDVIETIKDRYIKLSKDIIEKTPEEKIDKESFDNSNPESIKLKDTKEIVLKKCLTDELGFSNLKANGFEPTYNLYKKENKIILRIEASGNTSLEAPEIEFAGEYNIIKIKGEKKKDKEPVNKEENIFNTREDGKFSFEVPLKAEDYLLSNEEAEIKDKRGVFMVEFKLAQKAKSKGHHISTEDEI